jgi:hypothetical protein
MGHLSSGCHTCGKDCINVEFCSEGASFSSEDKGIKLPKSLKVKIIANPDYWGFAGVLTSGYVTFNQGNYDYFQGYDENWWGTAACEDDSIQASRNEKRPDVTYRSVFDPDTGLTTHYDGNSVETDNRGGAVSYLINRSPGQVGAGGTEDLGTCPEIDPTKSFKRFPENFGWANKINFDTSLYKNMTGAWRMVDLSVCYDSDKLVKYDSQLQLDGSQYLEHEGGYNPRGGHLITCANTGIRTITGGLGYAAVSGARPKQNLNPGSEYYGKYFDPARVTVTGQNVLDGLNYSEISGIYGESCTPKQCLPDGSVAGEYAGEMAHSGVVEIDGQRTGIVVGGFNRPSGVTQNLDLYITYRNWANSGELTSASGLRAGQTLLVKNSEVPSYDGFYTIAQATHYATGLDFGPGDTSGVTYGFSKISLAGTYASGFIDIDISGSQGSWSAMNTYDQNTCCGLNALGVDDRFKDLHCGTVYHSDFRRVFNDSKFKIQSNRSPENRETYDYGTVTPHVTGARKDKTYIGVDNNGNPSGERETISSSVTGYTSYFPRELPYYGPFYKTDTCDNVKRGAQKLNTSKSKNATCYTKKATLDVFPDCYTQYIKYHVCGTSPAEYKYKLNRVPRLSFVYRGCDFDDSCSFDESGRPYSEPTSIEDLRRGRGGEEIHMFINLGEAWASTIKKCECDDGGYEEGSIYHVGVDSPVTFPSFPDFDLNPTAYGCDDDSFQLANYLKYSIGSVDAGSSPDAGQLPRGFCDAIPKLAESCNVRQPYTTYGYIMNLCGKENKQRKSIIEAFNKLHQSGVYTHLTPASGDRVDEPMYRGFTVPAPSPYTNGDAWQTVGALDEDYIVEQTGVTAGYWGLRDVNGALISPYYRTESGLFTCPGNSTPDATGFINFSDSGNYILGWPTGDVPFLVQIEAETRCVGCTTSMMEIGNLTVNIETLTAQFLHQISHDSAAASTIVGGMYGYNHCNYGDFALDGTDTFHCDSGFQENLCLGTYTGYNSIETISQQTPDGDQYFNTYGLPHTGQTCPGLSGVTVTLNGRRLGSSIYSKGWQTGTTGQQYVKFFTDTGSNFINEQPAGYRLKRDGFSLYGKLALGCRDMNAGGEGSQIDLTMPLNMETAYMDIASADAVRVSFGGQGCPGHYPTALGTASENRDLVLFGRFWAVAPEYETLFEAMNPEKFRKHAELSDDISGGGKIQTLTDSRGISPYNIFGLCSGDRIYKHGCFLQEGADGVTMGTNGGTYTVKGITGMFFGVSGAECTGRTLCNTCDKVDWQSNTSNPSVSEGEIVCDPDCGGGTEAGFIGVGVGYNKIEYNVKPPLNYEFNNCFCLCEDPTAFAYYEVTGTSGQISAVQSMFDGLDGDDPTTYWYSMTRASTNNTGVNGCSPSNTGQATNPADADACNSLGPFMINTGPPNHPNIAFNLGKIEPTDWFSYSHGANKEVTGVQHDLVPPRLGTNTTTPGEGCNTLTVKTCETGYDQFGMNRIAGCAVDNRTDSANCKNPIFNSSFNDSKVKTNVTVRRKACFPEMAIVNKIECKEYFGQYQYYDLIVSREFYSHDRTWKRVRDIGGSNACAKQLVGAYFYPAASGCTGCTPIPYAVPSDLVTPVYEAPCSVHPSFGGHVTQDFIYSGVDPANTGAIEIRCDGECWYTYLGSWNFNASKSTCACSCSPPAGGGSMGEERLGTCS